MIKKLMIITTVVFVGSMFSVPVSAISEAYRAQLEKSGCTQISEANGTCDPTHALEPHQSTKAKKTSLPKVSDDLKTQLTGKSRQQLIEHMHANRWEPLNEEETRWGKSGLTAEFKLTSAGNVQDVIVK